ncbi:MAG: metalloregulator ArsR/SmtB family transcription factor [Flavobacteriaceae bacterium]|nr:metalloregulator ArsR/SmtB family transcription factor [Flavobacteriaceae bacterium]
MGLSKTEIFTAHQNQLASLAKALAHPARIAIIQQLFELNACVCGDLVEEIGLAQPTISQHLKELKNAGLITGNVEGTSMCYCIDETAWNEAKTLLTNFLTRMLALKVSVVKRK